MLALADDTRRKMREGLEDDMNTAVALAAVFDMVREANAAADFGELKQEDAAALLTVLEQFDQVFDVLTDDDAAKTQAAMQWARAAGKLSPEQEQQLQSSMPDDQVEALVAERNQAKRSRNFARADRIRAQLNEAGIILEDTKEGVRWKRK
jgi:cysteinyl-tRNA synthetase